MGQAALEVSAKWHALRAAGLAWVALGVFINGFFFWIVKSLGFSLILSVFAVGFVLAAVVLALIPLEKIGGAVAAELRAGSVDGRLRNIAEAVALGLGERVEHVLIHRSEIPNVGAVPTADGVVVFATSGAVDQLDRSELEALVAAQLAGMRDPWCRLATKAELAWFFVKVLSGVTLINPVSFVLLFVTLFSARRIEATRDLCADVAAVSTTLNPAALAGGMRHLRPASAVTHTQKLARWYLPMSPFVVLPTRAKSTTTVTVGNTTRRYTAADEVAAELGLRADRAEALAAGGDPGDFTGAEYKKRFAELGTADSLDSDEREVADGLRQRHDRHDRHGNNGDSLPGLEPWIPEGHAIRVARERIVNGQVESAGELARFFLLVATESPKLKRAYDAAHAQQQGQPAPGWYHDPGGAEALRWWTGSAWSDQLTSV